MKRPITTRAVVGGLLALAIATLLAVQWFEPAPVTSNTTQRASSPPVSTAPRTSGAVDSGADARSARPSVAQAPGSAASAEASRAPAPEVTVQVPSNAQVGDVFNLVVHIDTRQLVGRIAIQLEYDFKRLRLRSVGEGDFVKQTGARQRFSGEEPSDGKVVVNLQVEYGTSPVVGSGSIAVLEFEAVAQGAAPINVSSVTLFRAPEDSVAVELPARQVHVSIN